MHETADVSTTKNATWTHLRFFALSQLPIPAATLPERLRLLLRLPSLGGSAQAAD